MQAAFSKIVMVCSSVLMLEEDRRAGQWDTDNRAKLRFLMPYASDGNQHCHTILCIVAWLGGEIA